jgi:hypothetical protein
LFIAEGSDWNWWYGPEHHSANDRDFDELYRKHLSNVYQALGATPPDYLAQPIISGTVEPTFTPQTNYIHPRISGDLIRYFEWMGAAHYTADRRQGAMHGKIFLMDSIYAGIDDHNVYGRLDFTAGVPAGDFEIVINLESWADRASRARRALRMAVDVVEGKPAQPRLSNSGDTLPIEGVVAALSKNFEFKLPLALLYALPVESASPPDAAATKIRLRFSIWQNRLPADALPVEGWLDLQLLPEMELMAMAH